MRLTLVYSGVLHAQSSNDTRNGEKHSIRRKFHEQLKDLWLTHPALEGIYEQWSHLSESEKIAPGKFISAFDLGNYRFIPLVTKNLKLSCELDILFLRREPAGYIVDGESADIDNRIKVLLDALRKPRHPPEIPASVSQPSAGETPFFVFLEDDSLITRLSVDTDRLLEPLEGSSSDVKLILRVTVKVIQLSYGNLGLGGN